jgi:dihydrofolate reductase
MILTIVVAADEHNVIGDKDTLPWRLPDEFKRMKEITMGKPLIMGRKTHESIGRILPGRTNIVITRDSSKVMEGAVPAVSLEQAIELAKAEGAAEAIIFGGGEVYRQALPLVDRVRLTRVHGTFQGDVTFPALPSGEWTLVQSQRHEADARHAVAFTFEEYERAR